MVLKKTNSKFSGIYSKFIGLFACPKCSGTLRLQDDEFSCLGCKESYYFEDGIPSFFVLEKNRSRESVTKVMKSFYEENPFPNYENIDSSETLRKKASDGLFAHSMDEQIRHNANVLEVGCGTGQLSNFLGATWGRRVLGADMCLNSLKLGQEFKLKNNIDNVAFVQVNLFKPSFKAESFDLVICNGVLHHTKDPCSGFKSIAKLVKKDGHILIGLYNKYGRLTTDLRRQIFNVTGNKFKFLDPRIRDKKVGDLKKNIWFMDQYKNPHESKHTIDEVLHWFKESGFEFVNSIPEISSKESSESELFVKHSEGTYLDRLLVQMHLMFSGGREGGFFVMIGRRV